MLGVEGVGEGQWPQGRPQRGGIVLKTPGTLQGQTRQKKKKEMSKGVEAGILIRCHTQGAMPAEHVTSLNHQMGG